jgi:hypothetical protein
VLENLDQELAGERHRLELGLDLCGGTRLPRGIGFGHRRDRSTGNVRLTSLGFASLRAPSALAAQREGGLALGPRSNTRGRVRGRPRLGRQAPRSGARSEAKQSEVN